MRGSSCRTRSCRPCQEMVSGSGALHRADAWAWRCQLVRPRAARPGRYRRRHTAPVAVAPCGECRSLPGDGQQWRVARMRKRLTMALAAGALKVATVPGVASAAGGNGASYCSSATRGDNPGSIPHSSLDLPPGPPAVEIPRHSRQERHLRYLQSERLGRAPSSMSARTGPGGYYRRKPSTLTSVSGLPAFRLVPGTWASVPIASPSSHIKARPARGGPLLMSGASTQPSPRHQRPSPDTARPPSTPGRAAGHRHRKPARQRRGWRRLVVSRGQAAGHRGGCGVVGLATR